MRRMVLFFLVLILVAGPAYAWDAPASAEAALARGRTYLEVKSDPDGESGVIRAAVEVAAPPEAVWRVMVDCDLAPRMVRTLKSCRVLERDPQGRWDVREHISRPILLAPSIRSVFRSDYDPPRGFTFHRTGGDLKVLEGSWRLIPLAGGTRTRVTYESRAALPFAVPGPLARIVLREQAASALAALRRECVTGGPISRPG